MAKKYFAEINETKNEADIEKENESRIMPKDEIRGAVSKMSRARRKRAEMIAEITDEISLIDEIVDDGYTSAIRDASEYDREILLRYKNDSIDMLIEKRSGLEKKLTEIIQSTPKLI